MGCPRHRDRAPESELKGYLAKAILAAANPASGESVGLVSEDVSEDFEQMRWFDLPAVCPAGAPV